MASTSLHLRKVKLVGFEGGERFDSWMGESRLGGAFLMGGLLVLVNHCVSLVVDVILLMK